MVIISCLQCSDPDLDLHYSVIGQPARCEDKKLEPWDGSGAVNGDTIECSLDLDQSANGWDVNDMFRKNETVYGVQSTFDQSLTGIIFFIYSMIGMHSRETFEFK